MQNVQVKKGIELPVFHESVLGVLREGKELAITAADIQRLTGLSDRRTVYEIIEQLIVKYDCIIGANRTGDHKGYYLITNEKELVESLHSYNVQIQAMMRRHSKLRQNYINRDQLEMEM